VLVCCSSSNDEDEEELAKVIGQLMSEVGLEERDEMERILQSLVSYYYPWGKKTRMFFKRRIMM
jgi:hypothetical protein